MPGRDGVRGGDTLGRPARRTRQLREVDHDRIGIRTGHNPDGLALGGCVDLLVHRVRGNENEVSWTRLSDVLQTITPWVPGGTFKHVQDGLLIAMVVRTGRCAG